MIAVALFHQRAGPGELLVVPYELGAGNMGCNSCGAANPPGAMYCGSCGGQLSTAAPNGARSGDRISSRAGISSAPAAEHAGAGDPGKQTSDATRYLCAAVHLDSRIADQVVSDILEQEYKAPPSSPDVDLVPVVLHAVAARKRHLIRDAILTLLLIACLWFLVSVHSLEFWATLLLMWVVVFGETLVATYGVVAHDLRAGVFRADKQPVPNNPKSQKRLEQIAAFGRANVTVYSSFVPFVGRGTPIEAWSFALDLHRTAGGRADHPFTAVDVHDFVLARMSELPLAKLEIADRIYVDGRDIRGDRRFLPSELSVPRSQVDPSLLRSLTLDAEDRARPYLCFQASGWRGQLVVSTFLRFVVTGNELFMEVSHSLLTPVRDEFQEVDRLLPQPTLRQAARIGWRSLFRLPMLVLRAPFAVTKFLISPMSTARRIARQRREIMSGLRFDYGAPVSPRETASDPRYQRYFQKLDQELYTKVLVKRLLHTLVEFFEAKGLDTSELVDRQTTIENHGVYVAGSGTLVADSVAAGAGAQAKSRTASAANRAMQRVSSLSAKGE